jgi:predicted unusual protein kinase regulating ubiquinone biosynthesis (AarF/ABC1/UbiB family)
VPKAYPAYSSRRVLTSTWEDGVRLDEWLKKSPSQEERNRIGEALYEFYVGSLLRHGVFNADPHPGNYLLRNDGKLVILDYGCVREFSCRRVEAFGRLREAVRSDEKPAVREALRELGAKDPGDGERYSSVRILLRSFFSPTLLDRVQPVPRTSQTGLTQLVADKRTLANLNLPGDLLFLFRIRFGLHAVLGRIGAEANWYRLERSWGRRESST